MGACTSVMAGGAKTPPDARLEEAWGLTPYSVLGAHMRCSRGKVTPRGLPPTGFLCAHGASQHVYGLRRLSCTGCTGRRVRSCKQQACPPPRRCNVALREAAVFLSRLKRIERDLQASSGGVSNYSRASRPAV